MNEKDYDKKYKPAIIYFIYFIMIYKNEHVIRENDANNKLIIIIQK